MDRVKFTINGKTYSAGGEFSVDTTLNEFIRRYAEKRGTKYMCLEGGCGACVVTVRTVHPDTRESTTFSVNSCLVAIMSCDGWDITTVEGIGNRRDGYNVIQKRLNHFFGSQCGYCSPGFVMSMYSITKNSDKHLTEAQIENSFGSNLCRCTGYRPILEAFKSFAAHPDPHVLNKIKDIEDIDEQICPKSGKKCKTGTTCDGYNETSDWCLLNIKNLEISSAYPKKISLDDGRLWCAVSNIKSVFDVLDKTGYNSYMLVAGNTAKGAYPIKDYSKILIDINNITELRGYYLDVNLVLGASNTLTDTMNIFCELSKSKEYFWYLDILNKHIDRVAHLPVRNIGTLAGNLVLKHEHPDFQSDIFMLLDCVGATVTLVDRRQRQEELTMPEFLKTDLTGKIMTEIKLPPLSHDYDIVTYRVAPKVQNAHAEINFGVLFHFDPKSHNIIETRLVYGGINPTFTHAYITEQFLIGHNIFSNEMLQAALRCLDREIFPNVNPPEPSLTFRKKVALGLFYKAVLKLCPKQILNPFYASGAISTEDDRPPVSRSYQEYDTDNKDFPITQSLLKSEGMIQCAGEAIYSDDIPKIKDEVFASFVLSTVARADIESIDGSEALKLEGVLAVFTSKDIPGVNTFVRGDFQLFFENEELLASHKVGFYNQPLAIVVAKTQVLADKATCLVKVEYRNVCKKPITTIKDAISAPKEENRLVQYPGITPTDKGTNVKKIVKGEFVCPGQYHHMMELHTCVSKPIDNGLEIYSSAQFMDITQAAIALLLDIPENRVIVQTRRCGGAFGCKISRNNPSACATALAAWKLNRPCRMVERMPTIMRALGKRTNSLFRYEVGVDEKGEIQYMDSTFYVNDGFSSNENENSYVTSSIPNCYNSSRWKVDSFATLLDLPTNCFMRAPGAFQAISAVEHIMEHIAAELDLDPIDVRIANYRKDNNEIPILLPMFLEKVDYRRREKDIKEFNVHNRWKKRAIRLTNMLFPADFLGNYGALVSVYHGDGSVIINIGGIEIGQGLNTKMVQVAANEFGVPVEKVTVLPSYNFATPNNYATASSITTECCAYSVIRACDQINARLAPVRAAMPTASWQQIVFEADRQGINLQANYLTSPNDPRLLPYNVYGFAATEVEIDVLTGRKWIVRADVFEDAGRSINPALDVGQVEGAFVQSLSLWMLEDLIYNEHTGEIYTDRTWNYPIIGAKDIPYDFRVYLRRKAPNPVGILGSKATGEPAVCMGHVVADTLRSAIHASRLDSGYDDPRFINMCVPVTNESIVKAVDTRIDEFLLN